MSNNTNDLLGQALLPMIEQTIEKKITDIGIDEDAIQAKIDEAIGNIAKSSTKLIEVSTNGGEPINVGIQHKQFETILKVVSSGCNLILTGMAGSGKSHTVSQVAKALDIPFHSMSVSMQTTKSDLLGFVDANGVYRSNGFISAFRNGGLFNLDEIDASNANILVVLNSAISNGFLELPNGEMVTKHDDFRMVATANTFGTGANTKYVGRNKLDAATLDRFAVIKFDVDEELEEKLCGDKDIAKGFRAMRAIAEESFDEIMITQRACIGTAKLVNAGLSIDDALLIHCFKGIDEDARKTLSKEFHSVYLKKPVEKPKTATIDIPEPSTQDDPFSVL